MSHCQSSGLAKPTAGCDCEFCLDEADRQLVEERLANDSGHRYSLAEVIALLEPEDELERLAKQERCICVNESGYDSLNPLLARPCPVHSPEYQDHAKQEADTESHVR